MRALVIDRYEMRPELSAPLQVGSIVAVRGSRWRCTGTRTIRSSRGRSFFVASALFFLLSGSCAQYSGTAPSAGGSARDTEAHSSDDPVSIGSGDGGAVTPDCADDDEQDWIEHAAPSPKWWEAFVEAHARQRARPRFPRVAAPRVELDVYGLSKSSSIRRAYRQWVGRYRVCHEYALARQAESAKSPQEGSVNGYWVARVVHGRGGRVCTVEVLETTLPDELSACVQREVLDQPPAGGDPGKLETVITFYEP